MCLPKTLSPPSKTFELNPSKKVICICDCKAWLDMLHSNTKPSPLAHIKLLLTSNTIYLLQPCNCLIDIPPPPSPHKPHTKILWLHKLLYISYSNLIYAHVQIFRITAQRSIHYIHLCTDMSTYNWMSKDNIILWDYCQTFKLSYKHLSILSACG